jgi:Pentapeptide repeats (8 copies)
MKTQLRFANLRGDRQKAAFPAVIITALFIVTMALILAVALWIVPHVLRLLESIADIKDRLTLENEMIKNLVQFIGGGFLLVGLYFTWRNLFIAKEGQITERFSKAIDHLGDEKLEIRLGGIYALGRIAADSPKDYRSVMQVLCAFVRNRASLTASPPERLSTDVQAALTVIGERVVSGECDGQMLDLAKINIKGADLRTLSLDHAHLEDSILEAVDFYGASLRGADLRGTRLSGAHLRQANLEKATLVGADLRDASLRDARLRKANLLGAKLQGATLIGADLVGATYLTRDQVASAITDETTRMPTFLEPS